MSRHRFFLIEPFPAPQVGAVFDAPLSAEDLRHALRALRLRVAEEIDVVEPGGTVWRVRVTAVGEDSLGVALLEALENGREPDVTLVFGVLKGGKNDDVIEGAVEVGATGLQPVLFVRSIVRLDADKRAERGDRWRRVAQAAAKQSKRAAIPTVADPIPGARLPELLGGFDAVLVAWEDAAAEGVSARLGALQLPADARVAIVVGPEGGLSAEEVAALELAGALSCTLGATILRAETAGVVATALVVHELGGLGNRR
jgi:16S rRNA (uracil1498-N3)-methyltransferase